MDFRRFRILLIKFSELDTHVKIPAMKIDILIVLMKSISMPNKKPTLPNSASRYKAKSIPMIPPITAGVKKI